MRRQRREEADYRVTLDVWNAALDIDAWEDHWGGEEEGRRAWEALRDRLQTNPGTAPAPFWGYEEGIPEELRDLAWIGADPELEEAGREFLELRGL